MILSKTVGRYWLLQGFIIVIIGSYIIGMSLGFLYFINTYQNAGSGSETVSILLLIQSDHPSYFFNYSYFSEVPTNQSLLEHLNNTIGPSNWDGEELNIGWYIKRIFTASESSGWFWSIFYRIPNTKKWNLTPVGVSSFILNKDYEIKFLFSKP